MTTYRYPPGPFVPGSGFAIVGGTIQLAINQDGDAATFELVADPGTMKVRAYFRLQPDTVTDADNDPDASEPDEDEGEGNAEDEDWAAEEDLE